jgi:hypothetical protein
MQQIYEMLQGRLTPDDVMAAANGRSSAEFYAHLYVGLYYEALDDRPKAFEHVSAAAREEYATVGGYMHSVARVHLGILESGR